MLTRTKAATKITTPETINSSELTVNMTESNSLQKNLTDNFVENKSYNIGIDSNRKNIVDVIPDDNYIKLASKSVEVVSDNSIAESIPAILEVTVDKLYLLNLLRLLPINL